MSGESLAINTGQQLKVFDLSKNKGVWHFSEEIPLGYPIPTFDLLGRFILMPGSSGTWSLEGLRGDFFLGTIRSGPTEPSGDIY
jgi:hypothetical protein